jgi:hypothetical protein
MLVSIDLLGCTPLLPYSFYVISSGNTVWLEVGHCHISILGIVSSDNTISLFTCFMLLSY